jgi:hypothetical protein
VLPPRRPTGGHPGGGGPWVGSEATWILQVRDAWASCVERGHIRPVHPGISVPQAPAATSELCQLPGKPQLGADLAPCPGCRPLHVRGAHSAVLLEQLAEAGLAVPAGGPPGGSPHTPSQPLPLPTGSSASSLPVKAHSLASQERRPQVSCLGSLALPFTLQDFGEILHPLNLSLFICAMGL